METDFRSKLIKEMRAAEKELLEGLPPKTVCQGKHIAEKYFHDEVGFCHQEWCMAIICDCDEPIAKRTPKFFNRWE